VLGFDRGNVRRVTTVGLLVTTAATAAACGLLFEGLVTQGSRLGAPEADAPDPPTTSAASPAAIASAPARRTRDRGIVLFIERDDSAL